MIAANFFYSALILSLTKFDGDLVALVNRSGVDPRNVSDENI